LEYICSFRELLRDIVSDDVVTGRYGIDDPSSDDIILPQRDTGKYKESKDFG